MNIQQILKETKQMPRLLQLAIERLTDAERSAFISAFTAEVQAKEEKSKRVNLALGRPEGWKPKRPNNQDEVDRMMKHIGKLGC